MRAVLRSAIIAAVALAGAGFAAPAVARDGPALSVSYAPKLERTFQRSYGVREKAVIEDLLRDALRRELGDRAARVEVLIEDVVPNRPTFHQLGRTPGLSFQSFGIGGAKVSGVAYDAAGVEIARTSYDWYENDISWAWSEWTWGDADRALRRFSEELAEAAVSR